MPGWPKNDNITPPDDDQQTVSSLTHPNAQKSFPHKNNLKPASNQETIPKPNETGHIIPGSEADLKKVGQRKTQNKILILVILIILIIFGTGGYYYYKKIVNNPLRLITRSLKNLELVDSFTTNVTVTKDQDFGNITATLDYHRSPFEYSRGQLKVLNIENEIDHNLTILSTFRPSEGFFQASYSKIDQIEDQLVSILPEILILKSYQLIQPVLKGEEWLHVESVESIGENLDENVNESGIEINKEQEKEFNEKLLNSLVVKSHEKDFEKNGNKYHRIILGIDKDKLVEFFESFKTLDLEIELKEINSIIKIIQSVDNWNEDLAEILIEKETEHLNSIALSIPKIPKDALKRSIEESVAAESSLSAYSEMLSDKIESILKPSKDTNLVYIGKIVFSNYNSAPKAEKPSPLLESEKLLAAFEEDLPFIMQALLLPSSEAPIDGASDPLQVLGLWKELLPNNNRSIKH